MSASLLYSALGVVLFTLGLHAVVLRSHPILRVLALNVMASGVFLLLGAFGSRAAAGATDPVPQALVITGIAVAVSVTALALALIRRMLGFAEQPGGEGPR